MSPGQDETRVCGYVCIYMFQLLGRKKLYLYIWKKETKKTGEKTCEGSQIPT